MFHLFTTAGRFYVSAVDLAVCCGHGYEVAVFPIRHGMVDFSTETVMERFSTKAEAQARYLELVVAFMG